MRTKILLNFLLVSAVAGVIMLGSCKKGPGEGGQAVIRGTIWVENCNTLNNVWDEYEFINEYPGEDEDVYIIYGDDIGYGEKTSAGKDGRFEFRYLKAGRYRVYVQSKDTYRYAPSYTKAVDVIVDLGKKEIKELDTLLIFN